MTCKRRYADLIKTPELEYSTSCKGTIFDLYKISVFASWKPAFSLNTNSWIGGYQRFFVTVSATRPLQNFGKHSSKQWLSVKFRLAAYTRIGYDFIGLIFINDVSIHIETSIQRCSTFLHWIVWHSLTMSYCFIRLYIFKSELTDCPCLLTKAMRLFHLVLMIAYYDPCFWSKTLKNKLEAQNSYIAKQFFLNLAIY